MLLTFEADTLAKTLAQGGAYPNYFLVTGSELQLQKEAVDAITELVMDPQGPYRCEDTELYTDADNYDINDLLMQVNQIGLFGVRKFIRIYCNNKPSPKLLKDLAALSKAGDQFHVYCFILLEWDKKYLKAEFYQTLQQSPMHHCSHIECEPLKGDKYKSWIRNRLRKMRFQANNEIVEFLFDRFENNIFTLQQLLEQLKIRGVKELTIQELEEITQQFSDYGIFDLMPQVIGGNIRKANAILEYLVLQKKESIPKILGIIRNVLFTIYSLRTDDYNQSHKQQGSGYQRKIQQAYNQAAQENLPRIDDYGIMTQFIITGEINEQRLNTIKRLVNFDKKELLQGAINLFTQRMTREQILRLFNFLADIDLLCKTTISEESALELLKKLFIEFQSLPSTFKLQSYSIIKEYYFDRSLK